MNKDSFKFHLTAMLFTTMVVTAGSALAQQQEITAIDDNQSAPLVDLTQLASPDNTTQASGEEPESSENITADADAEQDTDQPATTGITVTTGLRQQNPSSIRLASLGVTMEPAFGLDRMLWQGSNAARVLDLYRRLPVQIPSTHLRQNMIQLALMRAVPPEGSISVAPALVEERLTWLARHAEGEDLASLIRQLPDEQAWEGWNEWLVLHDLLQREDAAACRLADSRAADTLDVIWHQINAFCMVIANDLGKASFALDILEDRGVEAPIYFQTMRRLTGLDGDGASDSEDQIIDQTGATTLDLVLLDSARIDISLAAISPLEDHSKSFGTLRHLDPEAAGLMAARAFHHGLRPSEQILAEWSLLPPSETPAAEALTLFSLATSTDDIAMGRLKTWQALSQEEDASAAAQLAMAALKIDFDHIGSRSLDIWMPVIMAGRIQSGPLPGLKSGFERDGLLPEAAAWSEILAFSARPLTAETLLTAGGLDAVPLLRSAGLTIEGLDWAEYFDDTSSLTQASVALPLARLEAIEAAAAAGLRGETVMLTIISLGEMPLHQLDRMDAARIVAALRRAGLEETARGLAGEILRSWVLERHLMLHDDTDQGAGDGATS